MAIDAFEMLCVRIVSIISPGTMKAPYETPPICCICDPIAAPNTTKYSAVVITGVAMDCQTVRQARCISPSRVGDWLNLLGFALEKRRFGCYRPPLASKAWQSRLSGWERKAGSWQLAGGGFYVLVARKMVVGLRPVNPMRREPMGKLVPLQMAKVNRRHTDS